jgi:dephospho-CoA kinase
MLKIGITGGIGAGKSIVSSVLEVLGYPVFNSDKVAKDILNNNAEAVSEMKAAFGVLAYNENDELDRKCLADLIFDDPTAREKINQIVHPKVRAAFDSFVESSDSEVVFNEAAILFETGSYKNFDKNILITAPESVRIERVVKRDGVSEESVRSRMNAQWSDVRKAELADYVVTNDESSLLTIQIENILKELI